MSRIVFLLEERSMKVLLDGLLPRLFPELGFLCVPHEGKQDLEKSIPRKLRAWKEPGVRFVVLRDNDGSDCQSLKNRLTELCTNAGRADTLVRIACQELEAWYFGQPDALADAFENDSLRTINRRARYRNPDSITNPSNEIVRLIPEFQKVSGARRMAPHLTEGGNTSPNFQTLIQGIRNILPAGFLPDLQRQLEDLFSHIYYLGPLREHPKRRYIWSGGDPEDMGRRGERAVDAILASRERGRYISPGYRKRKQSLEERVAFWLQKLGLIHSFTVSSIGNGSGLFEVKATRTRQSSEVLITDVGFGVSQILPVLVLCYYVPEGATILLEQPEIHLHPSVQMGMADVFIDVVKNRRAGKLCIANSQSARRLRALMPQVDAVVLRSRCGQR